MLNNIGWIGIKTYGAKQITVVVTIINNTDWAGVEFSYSSQIALLKGEIANSAWNGIQYIRSSRAYIYNVLVTNPGWYGMDITTNVMLISVEALQVEGGYRCINQPLPPSPSVQVECLP